MKIPFHKPYITEEEISEVVDTLRSGWLTTGPRVKQLEKGFAEYVGSKHAVAVNSCTAALHLALDAIGIKQGDEVITTPMTFAATAEVVRHFKAKPVFVDIEPDTMNINPARIEDGKGRNWEPGKAKAIIPVHFAGQSCDMDEIKRIADKYNLRVIEDAAHAFPARYLSREDRKVGSYEDGKMGKGKIIGTIGDITCFSFYATKTITTGEGGMITTENDVYAKRMRIMSLHGISKDTWKRQTAEANWYYEIIAPGYKYNLTDLVAALGIAQLKKADSLWHRRVEIASLYNKAFKDVPEIEIPVSQKMGQRPFSGGEKDGRWEDGRMGSGEVGKRGTWEGGAGHSLHLYVIKLNLESLTIDRNQFIEELKAKGVSTSVHFIPLHIHPYYRETYGYRPEDFPVAYETYKRIISLPIYPEMREKEVEYVIEAVSETAKRFRR